MDGDVVAAIVGAAALLVATWLQVNRSRGGRKGQLKEDLELLRLLPQDSTSRSLLLDYVDDRIRAMVSDTKTKRRDATGIGLGLTMVILAGLLVSLAVNGRGWWWAALALALPLGLIGLVGFIQDVQRLERDDRGRPIERNPPSSSDATAAPSP